MINIISATEFEIEQLKKDYKTSVDVRFIVTGIGIVNSTVNFLKYLHEGNWDYNDIFLNIGLAGGFQNVNIGDICLAEKEILADFGIGFNDRIEYFSNKPSIINLENKVTVCLKENFYFNACGSFITVNCVTTSEKMIRFYEDKFQPVCENMEGFPLSLITQNFNLNFAEIRVISNYMGQRENWQVKEPLNKLNIFLKEVISCLTENSDEFA